MLSLDRRIRRQFLVGVAVLLGAAALSWLVIVKPDPAAAPQRVWAVFDDATGISLIQRDVRVAGVLVGRIGEVRRVGDDAEVELVFDPPIGEIREDAEAQMLPHTPFEGTVYINLDPGDPSSPLLGDRPIPKRQTTGYVSLDQVQRLLKQPNRKNIQTVVPEISAALDGGGGRALRSVIRAAPGLLGDLGPAARALRGPRGTELRSAIASVDQTLAAINGDEPRLPQAVADLRRTLGALTVEDGRVMDRILTRLPDILEQMPEVASRGDRSLAQLTELARTLEPALPAFGRTVRRVRPVVRQSTGVLSDSAQALVDSDGLLRGLAAIAPTLRDVAATLGRSGTRIENIVLPMLLKPTSVGLPTYMQLLMGFAGSTSMHSTYQTREQNPLGWGHGQRSVTDYFDPVPQDEKEIP